MKKTFKLLSALLVLLCGIILSGCQHSIVADEDTWYKTSTSVKDVDVDVWFYYSTSDLTLNTYDGSKEVKTTYDPGLTIVAIPDYPGVTTYAVKHFGRSDSEEEINDDEETGTVKIRANGSFMDLLYIKFKSDFKASATASAPAELSKKSYQSVENISKLTDQFQGLGWKSILKEIVNNIL